MAKSNNITANIINWASPQANSDIVAFIVAELERLKERIIENHKRAGQVASGRTMRSMKVETLPNGGRLIGRFPFATLETGRKGGAVPKGFVGIIRQWMMDKGIKAEPIPYKRKITANSIWQPRYTPQERGNMRLAYLIAHKIAREGTKLYRQGGRSDIYSNELPRAISNIQHYINNTATDYIAKNLQIKTLHDR